MKKLHMILYTTSVIGFYLSMILLYVSTSSILGATLLTMSLAALGLGVLFQWKEQKGGHLFENHTASAASVNPVKA